jgi:hypothetical protein
MRRKYKNKLKKVADVLFEMNQEAVKDGDEEVKGLTCVLLEILENNGV